MDYLFIGEKPSELAIKLGVTWESKGLASKQLHDALDFCRISHDRVIFRNLFDGDRLTVLLKAKFTKRTVVAMGNKVSKDLTERGIKHVKIVHPAARGKIRKKEVYCKHVEDMLFPNGNPAKCHWFVFRNFSWNL